MEWTILAIIAIIVAFYIATAMEESGTFKNNELQLLTLRHRLLVTELQEAKELLQQGIIEENIYNEIHDSCSEEIAKLTKKIETIDDNYSRKS
tara:strand:- start:2582 stop:2860 length:279 start_codon:yes stop_codon:yes gene_type:complete